MQTLILIIIFAGITLIGIGWIWSVIIAWRTEDWGWFWGMITLWLVTLPFFAVHHWDKAKKPVIVSITGFVLLGSPFLLFEVLTYLAK